MRNTAIFATCLLSACAWSHPARLSAEEKLLDPDTGVMVVAHRACWQQAPENSLKAISDCIALGVDMAEIDVHRSADGELVLMHDDSVDRTSNGKGNISDLSLREIKALRLREGAGGREAGLTDEKIPTLKEALQLAKGKILVNIDAKQDVFADAIAAAESLGMADQIVIKMEVPADDPLLRSLDAIRQTNFMPKITQGNTALGKLVMQFEGYDPVAFEVKARTEDYLLEGADDIAGLGARLWVNTLSVSPEKAAGHVDDVALQNPDAHWGRLVELGVNMLQTDEPEALLRYLRSRGLH